MSTDPSDLNPSNPAVPRINAGPETAISYQSLGFRNPSLRRTCLTSGPTCHSAPTETRAFGFRLRANVPEGQKRFLISQFKCSSRPRLHGGLPVLTPS